MDNVRTHKKVLISSGILIIVVGILLVFRTPIYNALNALHFVPKKETYTELYFNNPESLPKVAFKGEKITFSFTIHNVEGVNNTYPYTVVFKHTNGTATRILSGTVTLADDGSKTIVVSHTFTGIEEGQVVVSLTNLHQTIDFLIPNTN